LFHLFGGGNVVLRLFRLFYLLFLLFLASLFHLVFAALCVFAFLLDFFV